MIRMEDLGLWWVFLALVFGWIYYYWINNNKDKKKNKRNEDGGVPKGNLGWPIIGESLHFIASGYSSKPVSFMDNRKSKYGSVFKTNILGTPIIVSTDPEVNKVVLQNHGNSFVPAYPKSITELMGKSSILQLNGNLHKKLHVMIASFLRSPQLKATITISIQSSVKLCLDSWSSSQTVLVQQQIKKITFDVLVKVLMSVGPGEDLDFLKKEFAEFIKGLICLPIKIPGTRLYKSLKAKERMMKMVTKIVEERKRAMEEQLGAAKDVVDMLLRETADTAEFQSVPSDFIAGNIIEMMIPGEETMPTAMTLAVKFLSDSPVALAQLQEENMKLKRQKAFSGEEYKWTDYMSLSFTQHVINETLRMANIINAIWRKSVKDVNIKGHIIPQGWSILASLSSVHMNENNYKNPYEFDPWRWEKMEGVNNINFTPFGGGQRLCPGLELSKLELAIFLHHLVTTYKWVAEEDKIVYFPTVKMKRQMPIKVTPISK